MPITVPVISVGFSALIGKAQTAKRKREAQAHTTALRYDALLIGILSKG
jgi:hypothetical protein